MQHLQQPEKMQGELIDEEPSRISTNEFGNMSDAKGNNSTNKTNSLEFTNNNNPRSSSKQKLAGA
jgi:hypothetical protein